MVFNQSLLHCAIQESETVDDSVFHDDYINAQDCFGLAPLHYAVEYDTLDIARRLMSEHGAQTNLQDIYGDTPLDVSKRYYSHLPNHETMCALITRYDNLRRIRFKVRILAKLLAMYKQSVHNVWKPGGVGYYLAKNDFDQRLNDFVRLQ
jgi:hypothetical protein